MKTRTALIVMAAAMAMSLFAAACKAGWTGVVIYVDDPRAAWNESSSCHPCNHEVGDVARFVIGTGWRVGFTLYRPDGTPNHIVIQRALPGEAVPYTEGVRDGRIVGRMEGYRGGVQSVIDLYPGPKVLKMQDAYGNTVTLGAGYSGGYGSLAGYGSSPRADYSYGGSYTGFGYGVSYSNSYTPNYQTQSYRGICVNGICY